MSKPGEDAVQGKPATPTETTRSTTIWWIGLAAALGVATIFVLLRVGYVNGWVIAGDYTPAQLAAAGGWVSGIGSLAAVTVALLSSLHDRRETKRARTERDEQVRDEKQRAADALEAQKKRHAKEMEAAALRHTEQLRHAQELLDKQIEYQHRSEQIDAVKEITDAIVNLVSAYNKLYNERGRPPSGPHVTLAAYASAFGDVHNRNAQHLSLARLRLTNPELKRKATNCIIAVKRLGKAAQIAQEEKDETAAEAFWTGVEGGVQFLIAQNDLLNDAAFFYLNPDATEPMKPSEDEEPEAL